jgi:hypothetical protein
VRSLVVALVVLTACRVGGSASRLEIQWQAPIDIATGGGTKGPWQQNNSRFDYVDDPNVALLPDGAAAIAWVDHRDKDVHFQIYDVTGRPRQPQAINISRSPDIFSWLPRLVVSPRGVFVLWQEIVFSGGSHGGEILFARSVDGGATFWEPLNLSRSRGGDGKGRLTAEIWNNGSLDLALAPDGTLHAAWTEYDGALWYASSRDGGAAFSTPTQVTGTKPKPARAPSLAVGPDGTLYLAWSYGESDAADIHVARRAGDRFTAETVVAITPTFSDAPKLAVDAAGTLHLAYAESTAGRFARAHIVYCRSRDRAKTFTPPAAISPANAAFPALALDADRVLVLWEIVVDDQGRSQGLGLAASHDGGMHFDVTKLVPHSRDATGGFNGSHQGHLMNKLAVHNASIAIVNSSLAAGRGSRVWLMRGRLSR